MSKLSFRARQVDHTKPLPIYFNNDLPDLQDFAAINRSVPQMPTGMEKEEETEHHLQRILSAQQAFGATSANEYAIPTPKVEIDNKMYERIYNVECPKHKQYIRIQPFSSDFDYPDYDVDYEDEEWINDKRHSLPDDFSDDLVLYFECIMDRLEKATTHSMNLPSLEEAKMLLLTNNDDFNDENDSVASNPNFVASFPKKVYKKERDDFVLCIYDYWKAKRLKYKHPLTPIVLTDKSGVVTQPNNPFLVFRRRTEKMQTRKNRKNEEQSYEKMLILKRDLHRAQQILKLIKKRENIKKEFLKLTAETFEKRFKANDYDGSLAESIACSLRPASLNAHLNSLLSAPTPAGTSFSNLINLAQVGKSNLPGSGKAAGAGAGASAAGAGSIDSKIASLIHSNKLKHLDSPPPHLGSYKQQQQRTDNELIYNNSSKNATAAQRRQKKPGQATLPPFTTSTSLHNKHVSPHKSHDEQLLLLKQQQQLSSKNVTVSRPSSNNASIKTLLDASQRAAGAAVSGVSPNKVATTKMPLSAAALAKMRRLGKDLEAADSMSMDNYGEKTNEFNDVDLAAAVAGESGAAVDAAAAGAETEDLDTLLDETRNKLSTSNEKDGYWCFKRKEGCQYLLQRGSIFKNDIYEHDELFRPYEPEPTDDDSTRPRPLAATKKRQHANEDKLQELQEFYYGYAVERKHRHLGLVRRRLGRGGRIVLDRFPEQQIKGLSSSDKNNNTTCQTPAPPPQTGDLLSADPGQVFAFDFAAYRTYYPKECFTLNASAEGSDAAVPGAAADATAFEPPPLKRSKLKFRSSFENLVQDLNEDDRAHNYYGLDDDSDESMNDDGGGGDLDAFFGAEAERERLFELPESQAASLMQFFDEPAPAPPAASAPVVYGHQIFNDYQMKMLDDRFSDKAQAEPEVVATGSTEEPAVAAEPMITDDESSDHRTLDDTNFTYDLDETLRSTDEEEEKATLEDFFPTPAAAAVTKVKAAAPAKGVLQVNLVKELNAEYATAGAKRKELPAQVARQAIKTLISLSMIRSKGIEVAVDANGATESSFKDEDTAPAPAPAPAKKKITDPDNLNDIFDSVINFNKEATADDDDNGADDSTRPATVKAAPPADEPNSNSSSDCSANELSSTLPPVIKAEPVSAGGGGDKSKSPSSPQPVVRLPAAATEAPKNQPADLTKLAARATRPLSSASINSLLNQTSKLLAPSSVVSLTSNTIDSLVQSKPPTTKSIIGEPPAPPPLMLTNLNAVLVVGESVDSSTLTTKGSIAPSLSTVAATSTSLSLNSTSFLVKTPQQISTTTTTSPVVSTTSTVPAAKINQLISSSHETSPSSSAIPSHMFYSSLPSQISSTANPTASKITSASPVGNGPVASSILLNNTSTNNIIVNGNLITKKKDVEVVVVNNHGYLQQESPSSTTTTTASLVARPPPPVPQVSSATPAPAVNTKTTPEHTGVVVVSTSNSSSSTAAPKISTNLSSHLQMNDNKNYHNLNVNNFMQHKKSVEAAVMSLTNSANGVSSTTTNENLPILTVVESTQTSANTDSNKSNVKPMEVT